MACLRKPHLIYCPPRVSPRMSYPVKFSFPAAPCSDFQDTNLTLSLADLLMSFLSLTRKQAEIVRHIFLGPGLHGAGGWEDTLVNCKFMSSEYIYIQVKLPHGKARTGILQPQWCHPWGLDHNNKVGFRGLGSWLLLAFYSGESNLFTPIHNYLSSKTIVKNSIRSTMQST